MGKKTISRVGTYLLVISTVLSLSFCAGMPVFSINAETSIENFQGEPIITPLAELIEEQPRVWIDDGDFIISYDEPGLNDSVNPDIAVAPDESPWAGSIHTVWVEMSEEPGNIHTEIHYSMSEAEEKGLEWSNDEEAEGDREISEYVLGKAWVDGDATYPSIAIDMQGWIHVVWSQSYPDGTYEVHYTRSEDNGKTWTSTDYGGDIVVSFRQGGGGDGLWINPPRIAVGNVPSTALYVVWSELENGVEHQEVFYSHSVDGGNTWSGAGDPLMISNPGSQDSSYEADVAVGGLSDEAVHVVWTQNDPFNLTSEVYYTHSLFYGDPITFEPETVISLGMPDGNHAARVRVAAFERWVHAVWDQDMGGAGYEVLYSGSDNDGQAWTGRDEDLIISTPDGQDVWYPDITTSPGSGGKEAHVVWTEVDETSPQLSKELHYSMNKDVTMPSGWTGIEGDIVLSWPDPGEVANVEYPAIGFGMVNDIPSPQIVWQEKNVGSAVSKAEHNTEIHYIPETTFDVPISKTGWNFISVPLVQNDTSITKVLDDSWGDSSTTWSNVYWYDPSDNSDHWKSYNQNWAGTQDLTTLDRTKGFWIKITSLGDGKLTIAGDYPKSTDISLVIGWNLVGYPSNTTRQAQNTLPGWGTTVTKIAYYNDSATYDITETSDGTTMMSAGNAYWVYATVAAQWTVNW